MARRPSGSCRVVDYGYGRTYAGEVNSDGERDGYGVLRFFDANTQCSSTYAGQHSADSKHGFGVFSFENGDTFSGQFTHGRYNGSAVLTFATGEREGETAFECWDDHMTVSSEPFEPQKPEHASILDKALDAKVRSLGVACRYHGWWDAVQRLGRGFLVRQARAEAAALRAKVCTLAPWPVFWMEFRLNAFLQLTIASKYMPIVQAASCEL